MENPEDSLVTRASLLGRLRDWDDQTGWREFFDRYSRQIYNVARKAGLPDAEAQHLVQGTLLSITRKLPGLRYDPSLGSLKGWLLIIVRSRITDFRWPPSPGHLGSTWRRSISPGTASPRLY
jgi:RNA polymerase sigma-70 factor (ECF subfamily)